MKKEVSFDDFDYIMVELFSTQPDISQNPREDAMETLLRVSLILTGQVYQPGQTWPEPTHPKTIGEVRRNLLIHIGNQISTLVDLPIYELEKGLTELEKFVESVYPPKEAYIDVLDLLRNEDD